MYETNDMEEQSSLQNETPTKAQVTPENDVGEENDGFIHQVPPGGKTVWTQRMKTDHIYKEKVIFSLALCWAFLTLGWSTGQFGPAFLDLQIITNTDVTKASAFLTGRSIGNLAGSVINGFIFDRFNKFLLVTVLPVAGTVITAALPWCVWYEVMVAMQFGVGFYVGGIAASGNALILYLWGREARSFMQALHFSFAFGGILSPLVTSPFLLETDEYSNDTLTSDVIHDSPPIGYNVSTYTHTTVNNSTTFDNVTTTTSHNADDSELYIAYSITAVLHLTSSIPLFIMYWRSRQQNRNYSTKTTKQTDKRISRKLPFGVRILVVLSVCCFIAVYCAVEDTFNAYLTSFCVQQLKWKKAEGSYVTSVYWAVFGFARFLGIWIVKLITPAKIIFILSIVLCVDLGLLSLSASFSINGGIWACVVFTGASMSLIYPCVLMLTEEKLLPVSGKVMTFFMLSSSGGAMINPLVLGYLMETFTPMWYTYLLFGESVVVIFLYLNISLIARLLVSRFSTTDSR
ncbi:sodium-dependent glucose transporter 1A-like [Argopecten irradians]|uniref:sodium-dependent glucose transporter 1A-like n=1 Tax=Argopecten irradians TaxID=31199 RepID=UPI00371271D2